MTYPTLDYLADLSLAQRGSAIDLPLPIMDANSASWDVGATIVRFDEYAILTDTYKVSLTAGASLSVASTSYFDPFIVIMYDEDGNAIKTSDEATYGTDSFYNYIVPYTGIYYINAGWDQGSASSNKTVTLGVYEDLKLPNFSGNDYLTGTLVFASTGNDSVIGTSGQDYIRGDEGNDVLSGGDAFDDINGNMGNDTVSGGAGDDYAVGGKDNDYLKGEQGNDIVWGNLGNDTQEGGAGDDQVRGGQGDDTIDGGSGNDFVSGDRGSDTISGGTGADLFHGSQDAGLDRVLDFSRAEGDRVMLDPGTTYSVSQVGADTVIDMGSGNQMILVGVQFASLTAGWIFGA